jgi:50S ribosomal protein L16 3-hydroxylase
VRLLDTKPDGLVPHELDHFDVDVFFSMYWRQRPLFVRGGAPDFLGMRWSAEEFDAARETAVGRGHAIKERDGEVTFIEGVSSFNEDLAERAGGFGRMFGAPKTWFDTVRTYSSSGIGAHFDHSDNFVLQQSGVKDWYLAPPTNIEQGDIARRMMNLPSVGSHQLPDNERLHFVVEPDDLLYIPLFWLHSGVSRAESLSLSLVCPAVSLYSAVAPFLSQVMKTRALGYQPIPAFHAGLSPAEQEQTAEKLRTATRALLDRLGREDLVDAIVAMQEEHLKMPTA